MRRGRGCNLAAGIIDIVFAGMAIVAALYVAFAGAVLGDFIGAIGGGSIAGIIAVTVIIMLIYAAAFLTFGIITIKICNKEPEEYRKKSTPILVFAIIESVLAFLSLIGTSEVSIIELFIILAIAVLHWVGFGLMKKGTAVADIQNPEIKEQAFEVKETVKPAAKKSKIDELQKLMTLKDSGVITEEEFEILKKEILK